MTSNYCHQYGIGRSRSHLLVEESHITQFKEGIQRSKSLKKRRTLRHKGGWEGVCMVAGRVGEGRDCSLECREASPVTELSQAGWVGDGGVGGVGGASSHTSICSGKPNA